MARRGRESGIAEQRADRRRVGERERDEFARLNLVGGSTVFVEMLERIKRIAPCGATVLIQGETGTGKEAAARAIHYLGPRHSHPFVPVNCGAIPDNLIENELFGHVRGAFTDAKEAQPGLIAHAEGGTLFLDEIECLPPKGQVVLLRFLQDGVYRPLGGRAQQKGDVRIIAASNRDLEDMVQRSEFRSDLFYRLDIMPLTIPPLRERGGDVLLLADYFIARFAAQYGMTEKRLDGESAASLASHHWPGNVRELENLIHREFLLADGEHLCLRMLESERRETRPEPARPSPQHPPYHLGFQRAKALVVAEFEKAFLRYALAESGGNLSQAARHVGKERRAFAKLLKKHGIDRVGFDRTPQEHAESDDAMSDSVMPLTQF